MAGRPNLKGEQNSGQSSPILTIRLTEEDRTSLEELALIWGASSLGEAVRKAIAEAYQRHCHRLTRSPKGAIVILPDTFASLLKSPS